MANLFYHLLHNKLFAIILALLGGFILIARMLRYYEYYMASTLLDVDSAPLPPTSIMIIRENGGDSPQFKPLVRKTAEHFNIQEISADIAYSYRNNLETVDNYCGKSYIPFKSNAMENLTVLGSRRKCTTTSN